MKHRDLSVNWRDSQKSRHFTLIVIDRSNILILSTYIYITNHIEKRALFVSYLIDKYN